jgi:3'-phosphoadenosine 5'-phosphosulfate sulfotransferase (PAPS reductase)/FAD synthetase
MSRPTQLRLDVAKAADRPERLGAYHVILVNSSAGKDSQAMLDVIVELADAEGVRDRIIVVHCDLGRVEWEGTVELAARQAGHYGVRFETVRRSLGDLLDHVEDRGMWPSSTARWCTSDHKTSQVLKLMTALVREHPETRPLRILNCLGMRAEESAARARKPPFGPDRATNSKRHVDRWLPIHDWSEEAVWDRIGRSGVDHHPAYQAGMRRLSCCLCVLASKASLVRAAQLNPALAHEYLRVERRIGHRFRDDLSMADILAAAERAPRTLNSEGDGGEAGERVGPSSRGSGAARRRAPQ